MMHPAPRIMPADRPRALRETALLALTQVPLLAALGWLKLTPDALCAEALGMAGSALALLTVCYLLPLSVAAAMLPAIRLGWRIHLTGESPPPGTALWSDTKVVTGPRATRRAWLLLALAPCCAIVIVLGAKTWDTLARGRSMEELNLAAAQQCARDAREPAGNAPARPAPAARE